RNLGMVVRQVDLDERACGRFEHFLRNPTPDGARLAQPQLLDGEPVGLAEYRQVNLQAVMFLQWPAGVESQPRLAAWHHGLYGTDLRAAMADRVAIGDFLVGVRLDEELRPGPAEHGLQIGLDERPF